MAFKEKKENKERRRLYKNAWARNKYKKDPEYKKRSYNRSLKAGDSYMEKAKVYLAYFRRNGCGDCDEHDPICLCAHHKVPEKKKFNIGNIVNLKPKFLILEKELSKCFCLCFNCHAKLHAKLRRLDKEKNSE